MDRAWRPGWNELHLRLKEIGTGVDQFWRWQLAEFAIDGCDLALKCLQAIAHGRFKSGENRNLSLSQCFVDVLLNGLPLILQIETFRNPRNRFRQVIEFCA